MAKYVNMNAAIDAFYEMRSDLDHLCTISDYVKFLKSMSDAVEIVRCENCEHYKQSKVDPSRKMCCRKDVDGFHVCYDFYPTDSCSYGKRREDE